MSKTSKMEMGARTNLSQWIIMQLQLQLLVLNDSFKRARIDSFLC